MVQFLHDGEVQVNCVIFYVRIYLYMVYNKLEFIFILFSRHTASKLHISQYLPNNVYKYCYKIDQLFQISYFFASI